MSEQIPTLSELLWQDADHAKTKVLTKKLRQRAIYAVALEDIADRAEELERELAIHKRAAEIVWDDIEGIAMEYPYVLDILTDSLARAREEAADE